MFEERIAAMNQRTEEAMAANAVQFDKRTYTVANEDFELIKVGRYKRATKESFEKWYHNQTRYQLAEDRQERS